MKAMAALATCAAALLTACSILPLGGRPTGSPGGELSPMGRELRAYRVAFHTHSRLSHDSDGSFERIAASAREIGLNAVILNDHYEEGNIAEAPRGLVDGVLFVPGIETRGMGGSLLAFGVKSDYPRRTPKAELVERLRGEGALVFAGHVERIEEWTLPVDGFEFYNLHAELVGKHWWSVLWRILFVPIDTALEGFVSYPEENLETWDRLLAAGHRLPALAGCDAHENIRAFGPLGGTIGTYRELFRLYSNHVLATELDEEHIVDAIRRGRVFTVFDHLGDGAAFSASYGNPARHASRDARAIVGESATFDPEATLEVSVPLDARIVVIRDGETLSTAKGTRLETTLPGPGIYRVEVFLDKRLWILASPMWITAAETSP